jgi:hypothetical protein
MGSSGMKKRRKSKGGGSRQHLDKVGTHHGGSLAEARHEQELERSAVADVMGLGGSPAWLKVGCLVIGAIVLIAAVVALISLD